MVEEISKLMRAHISELGYEPACEMFDTIGTGKMLRSKLITRIAGTDERVLRVCAVVELIQMASLLHDDVIDDADTRRGKPSTNALFGSKNAIMLGDILYSKGYLALLDMDKAVAQAISQAVCRLSIGELMDVRLSRAFNADKQAYLDMIYHKTAALIEASAVCGAHLAGFSAEKAQQFAAYGRNLGIAFQMVDDLLDVTSDAATLGKPAFGDFAEGKSTLPHIYLHERADSATRARLLGLFGRKFSEDDTAWVRENFAKFGIIEICKNDIAKFANLATAAAADTGVAGLDEIVAKLTDRTF